MDLAVLILALFLFPVIVHLFDVASEKRSAKQRRKSQAACREGHREAPHEKDRGGGGAVRYRVNQYGELIEE